MRPRASVLLAALILAIPAPLSVAADSAGSMTAQASPYGGSIDDGQAIDFAREGGLAGQEDRLLLAGDGAVRRRCTADRWATGRIDPEAATAAITAVRSSGLFDRDRELRSIGADVVTYDIRFANRRVQVSENRVPAALRPAVERLDRLLVETQQLCDLVPGFR